MASYHCAVKASAKPNAQLHAEYICREGTYGKGPKGEELQHLEHGNMPEWSKENPFEFWKAADKYERIGGRTYVEFELALPNELNKEQQIELVKDFVNEHIGNNHVYTFSIHNKHAALSPDKEQPHAHIMYSERMLDQIPRNQKQFFKRANSKSPELGGCKKDNRLTINLREARMKGINSGIENLKNFRESWARLQNSALEKYGHDSRVDHRSLKAQRQEALERNDFEKADELDREPQKHLGPKVVYFIKRFPQKQQEIEKAKLVFKLMQLKENVVEIKRINMEIAKLNAEQLIKQYSKNEVSATLKNGEQTISISKNRQSDEQLQKWELSLKTKEQTYKSKYEEYVKSVNTPEAKKKIAEMENTILKKYPGKYDEKQVHYIALNSFTKGLSSELNKESKELARERTLLKGQITDAKNMALSYKALDESISERIRDEYLRSWKKKLVQREKEHLEKREAFYEKISSSEAKQKIARIYKSILHKNQDKYTEKQVYAMALSSYTKGESSRLNKEAKELVKEKILFNTELANHKTKSEELVDLIKTLGKEDISIRENDKDRNINKGSLGNDDLRRKFNHLVLVGQELRKEKDSLDRERASLDSELSDNKNKGENLRKQSEELAQRENVLREKWKQYKMAIGKPEAKAELNRLYQSVMKRSNYRYTDQQAYIIALNTFTKGLSSQIDKEGKEIKALKNSLDKEIENYKSIGERLAVVSKDLIKKEQSYVKRYNEFTAETNKPEIRDIFLQSASNEKSIKEKGINKDRSNSSNSLDFTSDLKSVNETLSKVKGLARENNSMGSLKAKLRSRDKDDDLEL